MSPRTCSSRTWSGCSVEAVAGLLAMWRLHGVDAAMYAAWQAGVVLTGVSAGSICWHTGGPTDSFGPHLRTDHQRSGFVPYANGVHYDSKPSAAHYCIPWSAKGATRLAYATDDGAGTCCIGGQHFVEAVAEARAVPGPTSSRRETVWRRRPQLDVRRL